jgi:hypothetical protein
LTIDSNCGVRFTFIAKASETKALRYHTLLIIDNVAGIQAPGYSQSYNRYGYGFNNPLSGTDPSGFSWKDWDPAYSTYQSSRAVGSILRNPGEIFNWYAFEHSLPGRAAMDKHVFSHDWGQTIGHIAIGVGSLWCGAAAVACVTAGSAHVAGYNAWLNGGDHDDVAEAIITTGSLTFISAAGSRVIGGAQLSPVSNVLAHAALGCAIGEASGGTCGQGALSHGITAAVDIGLQSGGVLNTGNFWGNMAISVASGCLASHAGGGTCEAGARSSALIYIYSHAKMGIESLTVSSSDSGENGLIRVRAPGKPGGGGGAGNVCDVAAFRCQDIAGRVLWDEGYIEEGRAMTKACIDGGRACYGIFANPGIGATIVFPTSDKVTIWPWNVFPPTYTPNAGAEDNLRRQFPPRNGI